MAIPRCDDDAIVQRGCQRRASDVCNERIVHALPVLEPREDQVCGDRRADKREAAELIQRIPGLRCVDCGRLEMARITESLTALLISVNGRYKTHAGISLTGLDGTDLWPAPSSS